MGSNSKRECWINQFKFKEREEIALTLTKEDKKILRGLKVFPQVNLDRLEAHLYAGLPMCESYSEDKWAGLDQPAVVGCIVGVSFSDAELDAMNGLGATVTLLAENWLFAWLDRTNAKRARDGAEDDRFTSKQLDRLGQLVQIEVHRRVDEHKDVIAKLAKEKKRLAKAAA